MSRQELADAINEYLADRSAPDGPIDRQQISRMERGHTRWPRAPRREAFRAVLGAKTDAELGFYNIRRPSEEAWPAAGPATTGREDVRAHAGPPASRTDEHQWPAADVPDTVDEVRRRAIISLPALPFAAIAASPTEPWSRVAHAVRNPQLLDELGMEQLEWRTVDFFRREEHTPARQLALDLAAHLDTLEHLLRAAPSTFERRLLRTVGEALALAGWIAWDSKKPDEARNLYRRATAAAKDSGDGPLHACTLAYRSYMEEAAGSRPVARQLLIEAQAYVRSENSATTRSWLAGREAEVDAALGDDRQALRALDRAVTVYDYARPNQERPWTSFFTPSRLGSMAVTTYARLDHPDLDGTTDSVVESLPATDAKIGAVILADVATAAIQRGRYDRGAELGHQALDKTLAQEASLGRQRLRELHHLIQDKRHVPALADLDNRLAAHIV
ncbi:hypothetical protein [Polymorphospora rubra]|uniref:hypothetical protein n=1 Tax=Polymorphospora rubra TaxID=338584 RepID=UPI0033F5CEB9